jgi:hypothetical protein
MFLIDEVIRRAEVSSGDCNHGRRKTSITITLSTSPSKPHLPLTTHQCPLTAATSASLLIPSLGAAFTLDNPSDASR